jgi:glycosyltransferase involved in cell wall biosynthesis
MRGKKMAISTDEWSTHRTGSDETIIDLRQARIERRDTPTVSVIVPTRNEAANLPYVLPLIPHWVHEVIVVDSDSTDGTTDVAIGLLPDVMIVNESRKGKGRALCTGFEQATGDFIVAIDADGSTDPREIPAFVGALVAGADLAKGSRFIQGGGTDDMEVHRMLGNKLLTFTVNRLFKGGYSDLCYGYFAFRRAALPSLICDTDDVSGFEIETFLNIRALKNDLKVAEVASFEFNRIHGTSNLNAFRDGLRILRVIVNEFFTRQTTQT